MEILFIHGAGASNRSFNWISDHLPKFSHSYFSYDMNSNITECINRVNKQISDHDVPTIVVGHSLGGLMAAGVCDHPLIKKVVTMSTPLGGILSAGLYGLMNSQPMFRDLLPYSTVLYDIKSRNIKNRKPHKAFITTHGLPIVSEANDGVVMVSSQMAWETPIYEKFNLNHFEVLMDKEILSQINKFIIE
jgi:pimeloyl-ACP methyl ester carboxylesterase